MNRDVNKMKQIQLQLQRLDRKHWFNTLSQLINNYEGASTDNRHNITDGILEVLKSLTTNNKNNDTLAVMRFQKMFCFNYRFFKGVPAQYWDPTSESFKSFSSGEKVSHYEHNSSHPAPDILMRWLAERFNKTETVN